MTQQKYTVRKVFSVTFMPRNLQAYCRAEFLAEVDNRYVKVDRHLDSTNPYNVKVVQLIRWLAENGADWDEVVLVTVA